MPEPDRTELEKKVSAGLQGLHGEEPEAEPEPEETDPPGEPEETPESEGEQEEGQEGQEEEETEDPGSETEEQEAAEGDTGSPSPTLPDAHRRSMRAYGWTDEEIQEALESNTDGFLRTAAKMHDSRKAESAKWAALGRKEKEATPGQTATGEQEKPLTPDGGIKPLDIAALKEKYGDDELVDEIANAVNPVIQQVNQVFPQLQSSMDVVRQIQAEQLERQVDGFFSAGTMKGYEDLYGPSFSNADEKQFENRHKVLETADAIIAGARQQGRQLSIDEAMMFAHEQVASEFKTTAVRNELKSKVKARQKAITQKPTHRSTPNSGETTPEDLQRKVAKRMREIGMVG